jgi:hypothetical protein
MADEDDAKGEWDPDRKLSGSAILKNMKERMAWL